MCIYNKTPPVLELDRFNRVFGLHQLVQSLCYYVESKASRAVEKKCMILYCFKLCLLPSDTDGRTDETLSRRFSPLSCYCEVKKEEKKRWEKALSSPFLLLDEEDLKKTLTGKIRVRHKVLASIN